MSKLTKQQARSSCTRSQSLSKKDALDKIEELQRYVEDIEEDTNKVYPGITVSDRGTHTWGGRNEVGGEEEIVYEDFNIIVHKSPRRDSTYIAFKNGKQVSGVSYFE